MKSDSSVSVDDRNQIMMLIRTGRPEIPVKVQSENAPRILRRGDVAGRLSCSTRTVDRLAREGRLTRRRLPGRKRGHGFLDADVDRLIAGGEVN
jgi:hypothetical protein